MYAVITSGGKQYKVGIGATVKLEKIDLAPGQLITFDQVLLVTDGEQAQIGSPYLQDAKVNAEIITQGRHDKIRIIKFRRRKHHMKQAGHRQYFTEVKVTGIQVGGQLFETAVNQEAHKERAKESVQAVQPTAVKSRKQAHKTAIVAKED